MIVHVFHDGSRGFQYAPGDRYTWGTKTAAKAQATVKLFRASVRLVGWIGDESDVQD